MSVVLFWVQTRREGETSGGVLHSSLLAEAVTVLKSPDSVPQHFAFTEISSPKFASHDSFLALLF